LCFVWTHQPIFIVIIPHQKQKWWYLQLWGPDQRKKDDVVDNAIVTVADNWGTCVYCHESCLLVKVPSTMNIYVTISLSVSYFILPLRTGQKFSVRPKPEKPAHWKLFRVVYGGLAGHTGIINGLRWTGTDWFGQDFLAQRSPIPTDP
jgi:hypothetical protein